MGCNLQIYWRVVNLSQIIVRTLHSTKSQTHTCLPRHRLFFWVTDQLTDYIYILIIQQMFFFWCLSRHVSYMPYNSQLWGVTLPEILRSCSLWSTRFNHNRFGLIRLMFPSGTQLLGIATITRQDEAFLTFLTTWFETGWKSWSTKPSEIFIF